MLFTKYNNCRSRTGNVIEKTWPEWVDSLEHRIFRESKDGECLILGPVDGNRSKKNVESVHAIGLDVEGASDATIIDAVKRLKEFECFVYTTHSHGLPDKGTRLRIIVPLADPIKGSEHPSVWAWLNDLLGGVVDSQTKDCSRLHYTPSAPEGSKGHVMFRNEGKLLDASSIPQAVHGGSLPPTSEELADTVEAMLNALRYGKNADIRAAGKFLADGAPFAQKGERHDRIRAVTWTLSHKFSKVPVEALIALFGSSISAMEGDDAPGMGDVFKGWETALAKRKEELWAQQRAGEEEYSETDIARMCTVQGTNDLTDRWLVQKDTNFYLLASTGYYKGPYTVNEARAAALRIFRRAPVPMTVNGPNGPRRRSIQEIVETHGAVAMKIVADLSKQGSVWDAETDTMYEAVCPRRNIEPLYDERVDKWLKLFAGDQYEKLQDWLACAPDTRRLLCALYLAGHPGSGKTLLAHALARVWTTGAVTDLQDVLADFNEKLADCPLVLGDEALPKTWRGNSVTTKLRSMVSVTHRTLNRKHKSPAALIGAIRLVLTANNEFLLESEGASSEHDLKAIAQRFLYIEIGAEAAKYIGALKQEIRDEWLTGDKLAGHILYLHANRQVSTQGRFAVEGDVTTMHRLLLTGTAWNSMVCEWLVRYLMSPTAVDRKADGFIRREGRLLVNDQALVDGWAMHLQTHKDPDTKRIGQALRTIAKANRVQLRWQGKPVRYREIDVEHLVAWSDQHNIGDMDTIRALGATTEVENETDDLDSVATINPKGVPL